MSLKFLKNRHWSPYFAGVLIGSLQIPIFILLHISLGSSGAFNSLACSILSLFSHADPSTTMGQCFPLLKNWWQLGFVIGILAGAYLSSRLSRTRKQGYSTVWQKATNISSFSQRSLMAFLGGFIMLLGARIADGCTSGNGLSGIALLSVGSIIVIAFMFVGGILVAHLYNKV